MSTSTFIPADPEREEWDVIVVGCGMGGGTAGYELARLGRRVLFLEKGFLLHGADAGSLLNSIRTPADAVMWNGRWPEKVRGQTSFGPVDFHAPLGCGTGGSTCLYSGQLERFRAADFRPRQWYPDGGDSNLPEEWPVSLEEMQPFYRRAETLFGVRGTPDPLEPDPEATLGVPPAMSERDRVLFEAFQAQGLHPYRSHMAVAYVDGCRECDDVCRQGCKGDAGSRCVLPALIQHHAAILPRCEALALETDGRRVTGLRVWWREREQTLRAKVVVLGAGAWMTPLLLLRSRSAEWPDGLANRSGLVGRNLMLHATDLVAVEPKEWHPTDGPSKAVTLNDFYDDRGHKLGTFQSVGRRLDARTIELLLICAAERDSARWEGLSPGFAPRAAKLATHRFRAASLMATIVEDLPYVENRVIPDTSSTNGMRFEYRYTGELHRRNQHFQRRLHEALAPRLAAHVMPLGGNNINYGHVCGTCRFGNDARTSVLDRTNRAHEVDNLYVVDASFFPSSGATNPSLTIAANALRVGSLIHARL